MNEKQNLETLIRKLEDINFKLTCETVDLKFSIKDLETQNAQLKSELDHLEHQMKCGELSYNDE